MVCTTTKPVEDYPKGSAENPWVFVTGIRWPLITRVRRADGSPFSLTGKTGRSEIRRNPEDAGPPVATWTVTNHPTEAGRADLSIGATVTALIAPGKYVFDVEFEDDLDPDDVVKGSDGIQYMIVRPGVTKS